jgi:hypothetical protein
MNSEKKVVTFPEAVEVKSSIIVQFYFFDGLYCNLKKKLKKLKITHIRMIMVYTCKAKETEVIQPLPPTQMKSFFIALLYTVKPV